MSIPASRNLIFNTADIDKWETAVDGYATNYINDLLEFKSHERTTKI
jgi:hypothetical protein